MTSNVKGQGRKVTWRVWQVLADKSRTKRSRNTKIGGKVAHATGNKAHQFQGQRPKVEVIWWVMLRPKVRHILRTERPTKFKLGIQMEYEDPYHRQAPWPPKSNSKVARSRDASDSCWPISRELNVRKTPKLVERLPTNLRVIMRTGFKVKGQLGRLMLRPKVYYIFQTERLTNFKIGMLMEHALSTATASYERLWSWVLARGRGNTVSTAHGGHATCYVYTHVYCTVNKLRTHCIKFKSIRWRKINF